MWIQKPGRVNDRILMLGSGEIVMYLLKGKVDMLIGGGALWMVPDLVAQIKDWSLDMERVKYLFIGHTHFDHAGAVPYLQKKYPHLEVMASSNAARILSMPKAIKNARQFGKSAMAKYGTPDSLDGIKLEFDFIRLSRVLMDGDTIDLGKGLTLEAFETPGHSPCSMTLYARDQKWLFPSDAMPLPIKGGSEFICTASDSFVQYLDSLRRLKDLEVDLCAWEHFGVMDGSHADRIVSRMIDVTQEYKTMLREKVAEMGDEDAAADWAASTWLEDTGITFIPYDVMRFICRKKVRNAVQEPD